MDHRTRQCYIDQGFGERFVSAAPDADWINDKRFEEEIVGTPKVRLDGIHRIDREAKGEWIKYSYTLIGKTQYQQERNRPKTEGMWLKPIFSVSVDEKTGQHQIIDKVDRFEEVWTVPYSPEAVKKILALDEFNSNVAMSVQRGEYGRIYTITDTERFINEPMDKLTRKRILDKRIKMSSTTKDNKKEEDRTVKATSKIKETVGIKLTKVVDDTKKENKEEEAISKDALIKGISQSAKTGSEIEEAERQKQAEIEHKTLVPSSAYTGGNPTSPSSFWKPNAEQSAIYTLHEQQQQNQQPNYSSSGVLTKGSFESLLLQEEKQKQQQEQQPQEQQQEEPQTIKYFFGNPPSVTPDMLNRIAASLEQPSNFQDMADLMQNHQVHCIFCNGREIGYNRRVAKDHYESHEQIQEYRNRARETNKIWFETSTKLHRLKEQSQALQHSIDEVKATLQMMETAEDTAHIVQNLRAEQFQRAINENIHPSDIRNNQLDLGDVPRTEQEKNWLLSYIESANLPKDIGFSDALRDLLSKRKAARFA